MTLPATVLGGTKTAYNAGKEATKFNNVTRIWDAAGNILSDGTNFTVQPA